MMVTSYLNGILQEMEKNKHFLIRNWKIKQKVGSISDSKLIAVKDIKTAEAVKLFENVYRDVNMAMANEFALFCEKVGIDFFEVLKATNTQPYCHLFFPGMVNGEVSNDPHLLIDEAENVNVKLRLTTLARKINDEMINHTLHLTRDALRRCGKKLRGAKISIFGVSNHPNIKDNQRSSIRKLINKLTQKGVSVFVYDPLYTYKELMEQGYPAERTLTKTIEDADCLVLAVGHDKFTRLNLKRVKILVNKPAAIVDMCRIIDPARVEKEGLTYIGLGRGV